MRDPAVYLKVSDLAAILDKLGYDGATIAPKILKEAHSNNLQIRDRIPPVKTATERKKAAKLLTRDVDLPDIDLFQKLLNLERQEQKHSTITHIDPSHKDWNQLKTVVNLAVQFGQSFGYTKHQGFKKFIDEGLKRMKRTYRLSLFVYHAQSISDNEAARRTVRQDNDPEATAIFYKAWASCYIEYAGCSLEIYDKDYINYQHFVFGRMAAEEHKADYLEWIKAQFEGLQFTAKVPDLPQLYTDNALERYNTYRITKKNTGDSAKGLLKKILNKI